MYVLSVPTYIPTQRARRRGILQHATGRAQAAVSTFRRAHTTFVRPYWTLQGMKVAERAGFEPARSKAPTRFPVAPVRPLRHLSAVAGLWVDRSFPRHGGRLPGQPQSARPPTSIIGVPLLQCPPGPATCAAFRVRMCGGPAGFQEKFHFSGQMRSFPDIPAHRSRGQEQENFTLPLKSAHFRSLFRIPSHWPG